MATTQVIDVIKSKDAKKRYEFLVNDQSIATIDYPKRFEKKATLSAGSNQWHIARKGWWRHTIEITAEQSPFSKWALVQNWRGCVTIRTDDNRQFHLKRKGFLKFKWVWLTDKEETVVEIQTHGWPKRKRGTISIHNPSDTILLFLVLTGWFIVLTSEEDAAASAGV